MVYDRTCTGKRFRPGLSHAWQAGNVLYRGLGRIDAAVGVDSWDAAFDWLTTVQPERPIAEIQYWGHGKWGAAKVRDQVFDTETLAVSHRWSAALDRLRNRLRPGAEGLLWFRTCETFGCAPGQRFAQALTDRLGCRVAGHTYIIGHWQSGLHTLLPGRSPTWSVDEGLKDGTPDEPRAAHWSRLWKPNTISFLHGQIPGGY